MNANTASSGNLRRLVPIIARSAGDPTDNVARIRVPLIERLAHSDSGMIQRQQQLFCLLKKVIIPAVWFNVSDYNAGFSFRVISLHGNRGISINVWLSFSQQTGAELAATIQSVWDHLVSQGRLHALLTYGLPNIYLLPADLAIFTVSFDEATQKMVLARDSTLNEIDPNGFEEDQTQRDISRQLVVTVKPIDVAIAYPNSTSFSASAGTFSEQVDSLDQNIQAGTTFFTSTKSVISAHSYTIPAAGITYQTRQLLINTFLNGVNDSVIATSEEPLTSQLRAVRVLPTTEEYPTTGVAHHLFGFIDQLQFNRFVWHEVQLRRDPVYFVAGDDPNLNYGMETGAGLTYPLVHVRNTHPPLLIDLVRTRFIGVHTTLDCGFFDGVTGRVNNFQQIVPVTVNRGSVLFYEDSDPIPVSMEGTGTGGFDVRLYDEHGFQLNLGGMHFTLQFDVISLFTEER